VLLALARTGRGIFLSVIEEGDEEVKELSDEFIEIPTGVHPLLSPIV